MKQSFKDNYPDYESYADGDLYYTKTPPGLVSALKGLIHRVVPGTSHLKAVCNDIAGRIPFEPTQNWGRDFLINDLDSLLDNLAKKRLHKVMDFIHDFAVEHSSDNDFMEDLNDLFGQTDFGYRLRFSKDPFDSLNWDLVEVPQIDDKTITAAVAEVADICQQASDHLRQAREQLQKTDNPRAWKDALRDCLSAMEALVNQLGGSSEIEKSTKVLRESGKWGPDIVVKDGLGIWNRMHDLYPDIRHGNHSVSPLAREEAIYWIDRLMAFVGYVARWRKSAES